MTKSKRIVRALTEETIAVMAKWSEFATENNLIFSPFTDIQFKADVVARTNHCPCDADSACPCAYVFDEIKRFGTCFCHVFCSEDYKTSPRKFSHEPLNFRHKIISP